jgi:DNA-binding NarL/FixJ family response regulator
MLPLRATDSDPISILIADSNHMRRQLLLAAFRRHPEFCVASCEMDADEVSSSLSGPRIDVALLAGLSASHSSRDLAIVRLAGLKDPRVRQVLLLGEHDRDLVLNAFRSGVRGIFCLADHPFRLLCKCVQSVHRGQIWIDNDQVQYLVDAVTHVPSLRVVNASGSMLLTDREQQVVALVAQGLSNREVARELHLSEHTIKKYLFRIFEKVGVSSRVELVLYAVDHGGSREADWIPGAAD